MTLLGVLPEQGVSQEGIWEVADTPTLSIGGEASGPASDLAGIVGLVRLSDGRIVVGDRAQRLLVFDATGSHLRTFGSRGAGPGEFGAMRWIQRLRDDTILVVDAQNAGRLSYFTAAGAFVRSIGSSSVPQSRFFGALADGSLVGLRDYSIPRFSGRPADGVAWGRGEVELLRFDVDGRVLNSLGVFPATEMMILPEMGLMTVVHDSSPFLATLVLAGADRIYLATGDRFEVQIFSPDGGDAEVIRQEHDLVPVTANHLIDFFKVLLAGRAVVDRIQWERLDWNLREARTLPAISGLRLDDHGNVWIAERRAAPDAVQTWHVYGRSGSYLATVAMPAGFRPFTIGTETVLGVWQDQLGVEHVQLRPIVKR